MEAEDPLTFLKVHPHTHDHQLKTEFSMVQNEGTQWNSSHQAYQAFKGGQGGQTYGIMMPDHAAHVTEQD